MTDSSDALDPQVSPEQAEEGNAVGSQAQEPAKPQAAGDTSGPDLSFLDDNVRSLLAAASERPLTPDELATAAKELKRGHLRQADYTKKTQTLSQQRKEAEALIEAGKNWQNLISDEDMKAYILAYGKEQQAPQRQAQPDLPDDLDLMTGKELAAWILKNGVPVPTQQAPSLDKIQEEVENRLGIKEYKRRTELAEAANEWATVNDYDTELVNVACRMMSEDIGVDVLTPERVQRALPRYIQLAEAKAAMEQQQSTQRTVTRAEAASPRGGMGVASPTPPTPVDQIASKTKELGRPLTREERAKIHFDWIKKTSGKSESELEAEMFGGI